jgi:nickel superoxide dismutase
MNRLVSPAVALTTLAGAVFVLCGQTSARAHCQVPCGIYDDAARIKGMLEDATTIEKAVKQIAELAGKPDALSLNQATRWIMTKEEHATRIISTVAEYFLTQKLVEVSDGAPEFPDYLKKLAVHHRVMRAAMKTKQTVDPDSVTALRQTIEALGQLYKN